MGEAPGEEEMEMMVLSWGGQESSSIKSSGYFAGRRNKATLRLVLEVSHTNANEKTFHSKMFEWRDREYFLTNIVACRPPENRAPSSRDGGLQNQTRQSHLHRRPAFDNLRWRNCCVCIDGA